MVLDDIFLRDSARIRYADCSVDDYGRNDADDDQDGNNLNQGESPVISSL